MQLINFKRKKKKPDRLKLIKNKTFKNIDSFKKHFAKKNREDNFIQFFHIVRLFFAELFKIKYEFTFEELNKEIERKRIDKNIKEQITFFLKKLSAVDYSNEKLPELEIKKLLNEFLKLFEKLTLTEQKVEEAVLSKILIFLKIKKPAVQKKKDGKKQNVLLTLIYFILSKLKIKFSKNKLGQVHDMLIKALDMLNNSEIKKSKLLYVKIKGKYNQLDIEDKKEVYDDILLLYNELASDDKN